MYVYFFIAFYFICSCEFNLRGCLVLSLGFVVFGLYIRVGLLKCMLLIFVCACLFFVFVCGVVLFRVLVNLVLFRGILVVCV